MSEHSMTTKDEIVRGRPGTVATCTCGWRSAWGIQDGSAECDAHDHKMSHDPEYRAESKNRMAEWRAENAARAEARATTTPPKQSEHFHNCSCHLGAPCGACENCSHPSGDFEAECPDSCQDCEADHDY